MCKEVTQFIYSEVLELRGVIITWFMNNFSLRGSWWFIFRFCSLFFQGVPMFLQFPSHCSQECRVVVANMSPDSGDGSTSNCEDRIFASYRDNSCFRPAFLYYTPIDNNTGHVFHYSFLTSHSSCCTLTKSYSILSVLNFQTFTHSDF